jgi:hypothetical protein
MPHASAVVPLHSGTAGRCEFTDGAFHGWTSSGSVRSLVCVVLRSRQGRVDFVYLLSLVRDVSHASAMLRYLVLLVALCRGGPLPRAGRIDECDCGPGRRP